MVVSDYTVVADCTVRCLGFALNVAGSTMAIEIEVCFLVDICCWLVILIGVENVHFILIQ